MTVQHLKYLLTVAEKGSITEAAKRLLISQPSLSNAIKDVEQEIGLTIFTRMDLLESKYVFNLPAKQRFCVSTQHYTFTANAFVEMVQRFGQERFEFILNETQTFQIIDDVKNRFSDVGILFLSNSNETIMRKVLEENNLDFYELFTVSPHVFLKTDHPLAKREAVTLKDLESYPRLNFLQGNYSSTYFAEELFSMEPAEKSIKVSDRAAIVNLMIGLDGYTVSSGIFPKYLHGDSIVSIPLAENEQMRIGYILNKGQELSELGGIYTEALLQYRI